MKPFYFIRPEIKVALTALFLPALFLLPATARADTLRMMHYNLMYYTTSTPSDCDGTGSYLDEKDAGLRQIVRYVKPDVFCVNEIGSQQVYIDRFLNNVLNYEDISYYRSCPLTNYSGGAIANMLYYDERKLKFHSHFYISTSYRDINGYKLYYNSVDLAAGDTVFITFILAHLKAGSGYVNEAARLQQVQKLISKLVQIGNADNYVFSGDFNLYGASESAYQYLIHNENSLFQFYDPLDQEGEWNNNSRYASIHTQSTHTTSSSGECYSSGGMDDRFDFILVSPYIFYGSKRVTSINESYHALGQDGQRFNRSIVNPPNTLIPQDIANALYIASDHLPVIMDLYIGATVGIDPIADPYSVNMVNPVRSDRLELYFNLLKEESLDFGLYSAEGKLLERFAEELPVGNSKIERSFTYPNGVYFLIISDKKGYRMARKIVR